MEGSWSCVHRLCRTWLPFIIAERSCSCLSHEGRMQGAAGGGGNPGGEGKRRLEMGETGCSFPTQRCKGWGSTGQLLCWPPAPWEVWGVPEELHVKAGYSRVTGSCLWGFEWNKLRSCMREEMRQAGMLRIDNADLMNARIQIIGEPWKNTIVNAWKLGSLCSFHSSVWSRKVTF